MYDNRTDRPAGLTDSEFACLVLRSCGVPDSHRLRAFPIDHQLTCGFCTGEKKVA
jgi:hypothetical protein